MSHNQTDPRQNDYERLGLATRLALYPCEPGRILAYISLAESLAHDRPDPWPILERTLLTLLASASDAQLPFAWRVSCIDNAYRPYHALHGLPAPLQRPDRLRRLGYRLATTHIAEP